MYTCALGLWSVMISIEKKNNKDRVYKWWNNKTWQAHEIVNSKSKWLGTNLCVCVFFLSSPSLSSSKFLFYLCLSFFLYLSSNRRQRDEVYAFLFFETIKFNWERLLLVCICCFFLNIHSFILCVVSSPLFLSLYLFCTVIHFFSSGTCRCWCILMFWRRSSSSSSEKKHKSQPYTYDFERTYA